MIRRVLSLAVLFWMHQHLVRRVPPEEYVLLPVLMGVIALTPLISAALVGSLGRYVTEAYARRDDRRVTEITSTMLPIMLGLGALMMALAAALAWKIDLFLDIVPEELPTARLMFLLLVAGAAIRVAFGPFLIGFFVRQKFVQRDLIGFGAELVRIALLVYLLFVHGTRVEWVVVAQVGSGVFELAVVAIGSRRLIPALRFELGAVRRDVLGPLMSFGSWQVTGQSATLVREMAEPILLNNLASAGDVIAFNLGTQVDRNLRRTVGSATDVAQPATTAMVATGQDDRLRRSWFRMSRYGLWVMFAAALPLVIYRTEFFRIYLQESFEANRAAPTVLAILLARFIVLFPMSGIGVLALARARMRTATMRTLALESANLLLTLVLVGVFGLGSVGAALAVCVVALVGHPLLIWRLGIELTEARFSEWFRVSILSGIAPALAAAPVWLILHFLAPPTNWFELVVSFGVGWAAYAAVLIATLRAEDRADLDDIRRRVLGRLWRLRTRSADSPTGGLGRAHRLAEARRTETETDACAERDSCTGPEAPKKRRVV